MPNLAERSLKFELSGATNLDKYQVHSQVEIVSILRRVMQSKALTTMYFGQGNDFILSSILHIDEEAATIILDYGSLDAINQKALTSPKIIIVTTLDKVKIQFIVNQIKKAEFEKRSAFEVPLPEKLLRLQRREYFRLTTPLAKPIKCSVPIPPNNNRIEVTVLDISLGGIAMIDYRHEISLEVGLVYRDCHITLPDVGMVVANIEIRNAFEVTLKNGNKCKRSGCQFVNLAAPMVTMVQRYILQQERERAKAGKIDE